MESMKKPMNLVLELSTYMSPKKKFISKKWAIISESSSFIAGKDWYDIVLKK